MGIDTIGIMASSIAMGNEELPIPDLDDRSSPVVRSEGATDPRKLLIMPPGLAIQIGAVGEDAAGELDDPQDDWSLTSTSKWKVGEERMIQALTDQSFTKVCIDSGAGESVCPVDAFPSYVTKQTAKVGARYTAAGGQSLVNVGEERPEFTTSGVDAWMAFQATTKVTKPLAAATKITAKGNGIWLDDVDSESYILNKKTGKKVPLAIENGVYMLEMLVKPPSAAAPFQGQAKP